MSDKFKTITKEEVEEWCSDVLLMTPFELTTDKLWEILTGEYDLKIAREDILSLRDYNPDN